MNTASTTINDMLQIRSHDPDRPSRVIGLKPTGEGRWARVALQLVTDTEALTFRTADLRMNRNVGPAERGQRVRELAGPYLPKLQALAAEVALGKQGLAQRMAVASATKDYTTTGHWQPAFDLRIVDSLAAQGPHKRASKIAELLANPLSDLDTIEALVRLPAAVSGLDVATRAALRVAAFRTLKHDDAAVLDAEIEQLALAEATVRAAVETVRDQLGSVRDVLEHAPAALSLTQDAARLQWPELRTEAAPSA